MDRVHQSAGDWNFVFGVFGERDADRVADAIGKEAADADGAFDPAVLAVAGFGDAEMNRVVPATLGAIQFVEARDEQAVGLDHHLRVRRLHRENDVVVVEFAGNAGKFQRALDHAERRVAEAVHDAVAQAAVVRADAHRDAALFAKIHERRELFSNAPDLGGVFLVGVFANVKFFRVGEIARVDANFFNPLGGFQGGFGLEMDVCDEWDIAASFQKSGADAFQIARVFHGRSGDAHDFAAGFDESEGFANARVGIHRVAGEHRLNPNRIFPADGGAPGLNPAGLAAAGVVVELRRHGLVRS